MPGVLLMSHVALFNLLTGYGIYPCVAIHYMVLVSGRNNGIGAGSHVTFPIGGDNSWIHSRMFLPKSHVQCLFFLKMFSSASSPLVRVRYGSARGEVLRGSSCALIGWFPGIGLACPVIGA